MADILQSQAEAVMVQLESRFGASAMYVKKGNQSADADGDISSTDTPVACTLVPGELTQRDLAAIGTDMVEQTLRVYKGRQSVLGNGLSKGDQATIAGSTYEVMAPVILDALGVTYRLITREIH